MLSTVRKGRSGRFNSGMRIHSPDHRQKGVQAMKKSKSVQRLEAAGFTVGKIHRGRWFEVTKNGEAAVIVRQHENCWHWFAMANESTASGSSPERCDTGLLGDVIGTDAELRTYRRLVLDAPTILCRKCSALYRASSDEFNAR